MSKVKKTEFAKSLTKLLNTEVIYTYRGKKVTGTLIDIRHSMSTIMNLKTYKQYPAAEFKIKPKDGRPARWTRPFKNV